MVVLYSSVFLAHNDTTGLCSTKKIISSFRDSIPARNDILYRASTTRPRCYTHTVELFKIYKQTQVFSFDCRLNILFDVPEYVRSLEENESVTSGTSKVKNSCFHDIFLRVHP